MAEIRALLLKGDKASKKKAQQLNDQHLRGLGHEDRDKADTNFGRYETLGELLIATGHPAESDNLKYRRHLDWSSHGQL